MAEQSQSYHESIAETIKRFSRSWNCPRQFKTSRYVGISREQKLELTGIGSDSPELKMMNIELQMSLMDQK
jgi:hypothetical protein